MGKSENLASLVTSLVLQNTTTNGWVFWVIELGFRLPWVQQRAPLIVHPPPLQPPASPDAGAALAREAKTLLFEQVVENVSPPPWAFYGQRFVVPKPGRCCRLIVVIFHLEQVPPVHLLQPGCHKGHPWLSPQIFVPFSEH